jgi:hypothetical protein
MGARDPSCLGQNEDCLPVSSDLVVGFGFSGSSVWRWISVGGDGGSQGSRLRFGVVEDLSSTDVEEVGDDGGGGMVARAAPQLRAADGSDGGVESEVERVRRGRRQT